MRRTHRLGGNGVPGPGEAELPKGAWHVWEGKDQ